MFANERTTQWLGKEGKGKERKVAAAGPSSERIRYLVVVDTLHLLVETLVFFLSHKCFSPFKQVYFYHHHHHQLHRHPSPLKYDKYSSFKFQILFCRSYRRKLLFRFKTKTVKDFANGKKFILLKQKKRKYIFLHKFSPIFKFPKSESKRQKPRFTCLLKKTKRFR